MRPSSDDRSAFRSVLKRTIALPLLLLLAFSAALVGVLVHLARLHREVDHSDQVMARTTEVQKLYLDAETGMRGFLLTEQPEFLEPYLAARKALPAATDALARLLADSPEQAARLAEIRTRGDAWMGTAEARIANARRGERPSPEESLNGKARMDGVRSIVNQLLEAEGAERAARTRDTESAGDAAIWGTILAALAIGGVLAVGGRRQLVSLSSRFERTLAAQLRQTEALQAQDWVSRGRAQLSDEVHGELDEAGAAERVLSALARYTGATVGVLYTLDEAGARLDLRAGYACADGDRGPPRALALGNTWLGQAAREGRVVRLAELPPDHVKVASATGASSPRELVIAPLLADARLVAVVELGFLERPAPRVLDYLAAASEPAGFALRSARYRAHLQELLGATQRQAHDLQTQQEELRVVNEELQEQSQALLRSQARLEEQQEELKVTNVQLEDQARRLELQRDDLEAAQGALVEKADQLARANQYKSEFLANMSHELRTPLNSSLILARLLADNKDANLTAEQVRFAETIYSAGNDLLSLINDILDLSRIEAGKMNVQAERVELPELAGVLERMFQPVARQRGVAFSVAIDPGAPASLDTDPQRLRQILKNLLANAFKFTERGEVSLRVAASGADRVAFVVRDTGIGIAPADQQVVFEAFRQVDGSVHRQHGGTGLGLTISRDLARRLGGDIHLESVPGEGSAFSLILPVSLGPVAAAREAGPATEPRAAATPAAGPAAAPSRAARPPPARRAPEGPSAFDDDRATLRPGGRTLLVVEDDLRFARILYDLAHEQQFQCIVSPTAGEAFALARAHQPSGIVLDVNLPDGSGLAVLEHLKRSPETRHVPVHVVSVADYTQRALEMGAIGYALKPVGREQLAEALGRLGATSSADRLRRVLVVEDVEVQRDGLRRLLESDGVGITAVGTAAQALAELERGTFDCMVLDLGLPDMSGFELLERMSSDAAYSFPPVIVYTARALSPDEELRLRRYSRSVVIKGARSPERLLDEVTLFIHRVESALPREQQRLLREARNRDAVLEGRRVLLVEDDVRNVFALTSVLEGKGAELEVARNGREALDALARRADGGVPVDLVLMDVMMPVMDGLTAIREIRAQPTWRKLPIIALTAKAMPEDRESCLAAGASDYIAKPLDVEKLLSLVRVWMPRGA